MKRVLKVKSSLINSNNPDLKLSKPNNFLSSRSISRPSLSIMTFLPSKGRVGTSCDGRGTNLCRRMSWR